MTKRKEKSESEVVAPKKVKKNVPEVSKPQKPSFEKKSKAPKPSKTEPKKFVKGAQTQKPEDWNEFKKKKKELRLKRRQNKPGFDVIIEAKKLGEKLRCKNLKGGPEERNILINKLHSLLKGQGHYSKFVLAHDTSRIVQWLLKYSSDFVKKQISEELIPVTVEMLQSRYGIFCIKRLLKYGSHETRSLIINQMYGHAVKLSSHALSAPVFEYAYSTWATTQQKQHLIQEFFGEMYRTSKDNEIKHLRDVFKQSPDLKTAVLSAVKSNLNRILDKSLLDSGLVQSVLNQFLSECSEEDRTELISQLVPHIVVISNSKEGSRAAMQCIWHGSNKDRKLAMKTIKEHVLEMSKHEHAHCTIITLLGTADDTVLLHKIIISEILKGARDLAVHEWGRKVLLWLVAPANPTCFHPVFVKELQEGREKSNSKKDPKIRQKEILEYSVDTLLNLVAEEPEFWLGNSSLAYEMLEIIRSGIARGDALKKALESVANVVVKPDWQIKINEREIAGIEDAGMHMILKKLAKNDQNIEDQECSFGAILVDLISEETLSKWLVLNRGCFVLVTIFENNKPAQESLKKMLKKHKKLLKAQESTGSKILLKKIAE